MLFGLTPADAGEIHLGGQRVTIASPQEAVARGIAYVPEDRRRHGVILEMPIDANISLASLDRLSRASGLDVRQERALALGEHHARVTP